jgi:arylsulfatase A-like enzyme
VLTDRARRQLAGYYAQIENWDHNIGRIRRALAESGLQFNTHLMVFSDHGEMAGSHGQFRKMTPHEESIRIPMIISGEQPTYNGRIVGRPNVPFNHVDIAPTTLGLCGVAKPSWMEGTDYSRHRLAARPAVSEPDSAFLQSVIPTMHNESVNKPWRGIVTRDGWKYVCFEGISWLMFNLNDDPYELVDVAHNNGYKAERAKLISRLKQWINDTGDKFTVPAD